MTLSQYLLKVLPFCKTDVNTGMPNLDSELAKEIAVELGLTFIDEKEKQSEVCFANSPDLRPEFKQSFTSIDFLDYSCAILHSTRYRTKYKHLLEIDFPAVPFPKDTVTFWKLVPLGGELRKINLLENPTEGCCIAQYHQDGDNVITKIQFVKKPISNSPAEEGNLQQLSKEGNLGNVFINENQYFAKVPELAWNFHNGASQPAQKWLQDRKGQELTDEDMLCYQKMLTALYEKARIIAEIDSIGM